MLAVRSILIVALAGLGAASLGVPEVAHAADDAAEMKRLLGEIRKGAQRNQWPRVESAYEKMLELKSDDIPLEAHQVGAQSASVLGKTWERYKRLERAQSIENNADVAQTMSSIEGMYGFVELKGSEKNKYPLAPDMMPFAPDQRKSIEWAQTVVEATGSFKGMLPAGGYKIGNQAFQVEAGKPDFQTIKVRKLKCSELKEMGLECPALIVYHGPVATVGAGALATSEGDVAALPPGQAVGTSTTVIQPAAASGAGLSFNAGYEVGWSSLFGTSLSLGIATMTAGQTSYPDGAYQSGPADFENYNVWLAAAIRPSVLRIAIGPTYNVFAGRGSGVWQNFEPDPVGIWDAGTVGDDYRPDDISWQGLSTGPGMKMSVGVGFGEFGPIRLAIEVGGSWATDGIRSFYTGGLRVGIVPLIERFEG